MVSMRPDNWTSEVLQNSDGGNSAHNKNNTEVFPTPWMHKAAIKQTAVCLIKRKEKKK